MMRPFTLRVLVPFALIVLLLPACSDSDGEAGDSTLAPVTAEAVTDAESVLRVDSSGGTVELTEGEAFAEGARVVIPPNALTEETPIALRAQAGGTGPFAPEPAVVAALVDYSFAAAASSDSHPIATPVAILANAVPIGPEFIVSPDGAQFALPVSLEIPVEVAPVPHDAQLLALLESRDGSVDVVDDVEITDDRVVVSLDHFSTVKLISIPLNVLHVFIFGSDEAAMDHAMDLVGPHVEQVTSDVVSVHCGQRGSVTFNPDRLPSYPDLLKNLALQDTEPMGGIEYDHLWEMKKWMENIGDQGLPSVSVAEIYNQALGVAGGDVFGALVLAHETLRDDRFAKEYTQLVTDVRGDATDEVGARYHLFGTAVYGFWYAYQQEHPDPFWSTAARASGAPPIPTPEEAAAYEEAYVSGDISTDPGEFVVDLAGAQLGRDLYQAVRAAQDSSATDPCPEQPDSPQESDVEVAAPEFPLPRTFAGAGKLTFTSDFTTGACIMDYELSVTLLPDGLVEGTLEGTTFRFTFETSDGVTALVCIDGDQYVTDLVGTHGAGELRLSVASSPDEVWLPGGYQPDLLTIDHQIQSEVSQDVTITYFSDWVFMLPSQNG